MEIISIGEKIKRLRIYRGIKLKDICNENLSISKISCIENNKIKPDKTSLEILASKLGTSYDYLSKDIFEQIYENIKLLDKNFKADYIKEYKYNLNIALKYKIYDLVFYICNNLFGKIVFNKEGKEFNLDDIFEIIPIYFESLIEIKDINKEIIYNLDLASYFFLKKEYKISSNYFKTLRKFSYEFGNLEEFKNVILINELNCYFNLKLYDKILNLKEIIHSCVLYLDNQKLEETEEFKFFNVVCIIKAKFSEFSVQYVLDLFSNCENSRKIFYFYKICCVLEDLNYLNECINLCDVICDIIFEDNSKDLNLICKVLSFVSRIYMENNVFNRFDYIMEEFLNLSISFGKEESICEAYFNKALFYKEVKNLDKSEIYTNFTNYFLDRLSCKSVDKSLNIGFMFYRLGNIYKAVKNFKFVIEKRCDIPHLF